MDCGIRCYSPVSPACNRCAAISYTHADEGRGCTGFVSMHSKCLGLRVIQMGVRLFSLKVLTYGASDSGRRRVCCRWAHWCVIRPARLNKSGIHINEEIRHSCDKGMVAASSYPVRPCGLASVRCSKLRNAEPGMRFRGICIGAVHKCAWKICNRFILIPA